MRGFFIDAFEKMLIVVVVLLGIIVIVMSAGIMFGNGMMGPGGRQMGRFVPGLIVLIVGAVYVTLVGGLMYLGLGIYQNTKRTADLL
jgi:hypothetical protein